MFWRLTSVNLKNNVQVLEENNDIGYPNFSKADAFVLFNALDGNQAVIKGVALKSDKISRMGLRNTVY